MIYYDYKNMLEFVCPLRINNLFKRNCIGTKCTCIRQTEEGSWFCGLGGNPYRSNY